MTSSLLENRGKTHTPPSPPNDKKDKGDGDDNDPRGHILLYGENEAELEGILRIPKMMADLMWSGMFHVSGFSKIDDLESHLHRKVLQDPRLLVSLVYLITQENVKRCLGSFLGFFEKVPGFESSSDLQEKIGEIKQKINPKMLADLYPEHSTSEEVIQSILLQGETKSRVARALLCVHKGDSPMVLGGPMDPILDRLPDIGDIIRRKFSQPAILGAPVEAIIVEHMTNFTISGDE